MRAGDEMKGTKADKTNTAEENVCRELVLVVPFRNEYCASPTVQSGEEIRRQYPWQESVASTPPASGSISAQQMPAVESDGGDMKKGAGLTFQAGSPQQIIPPPKRLYSESRTRHSWQTPSETR